VLPHLWTHKPPQYNYSSGYSHFERHFFLFICDFYGITLGLLEKEMNESVILGSQNYVYGTWLFWWWNLHQHKKMFSIRKWKVLHRNTFSASKNSFYSHAFRCTDDKYQTRTCWTIFNTYLIVSDTQREPNLDLNPWHFIQLWKIVNVSNVAVPHCFFLYEKKKTQRGNDSNAVGSLTDLAESFSKILQLLWGDRCGGHDGALNQQMNLKLRQK